MNFEQAQLLRNRLIPLEGLFAWKTREYIWKVLIGPEGSDLLDIFRNMVDPTRPLDPRKIVKPFMMEELSVYFFLKTGGVIICREYGEFLLANDMRVGEKDCCLEFASL